MTELEITERLILAAEIEDRLPRVGPAHLKAQQLAYVHSDADMRGWGKRRGEKDQLKKEDAEAHAAHRREFWDKVIVSARNVSEAEEAWGWLALVDDADKRVALASWAGCMADNKRRFFKDWCRRAGISEKTGRKRKDAAVSIIHARLARSDVQDYDIDLDEGLLECAEMGHVDGRIGNARRNDPYLIKDSTEPNFSWSQKRNERRRQQEAKRRREAA